MITTNITHGGNFIVTSKDPAGPWSDPNFLEGAQGIDPSLFFDNDGKVYYVGTILERDFYRDFMNDVIEGTNVEVFQGLADGVEVSVRENTVSRYLLIFNNTNHVQEVNLTDIERTILNPFDLKVVPFN